MSNPKIANWTATIQLLCLRRIILEATKLSIIMSRWMHDNVMLFTHNDYA